MHDNAASAAVRAIGKIDSDCLSDDDICRLNIADFMAYLGKRIINPGGIEGRERMLEILQPKAGSHVLVIGADKGHAACHIARKHGCRVAALEHSLHSVDEAQAYVRRLGLADLVWCESGDVNELRFADSTFDYVVCQAFCTFAPYRGALSEIRRVLKDDGVFAGLEFCWRRQPPEPLRERTAHFFGCKTVDFHSLYGWIGALRGSNFDVTHAAEYPMPTLSLAALLCDEAWPNRLRIVAKLLQRRASIVRMAEIWSHFSRSIDYYSYIVFCGGKAVTQQTATRGHGNGHLALQTQGT